jgi:flavin-dependent dehydrogenase
MTAVEATSVFGGRTRVPLFEVAVVGAGPAGASVAIRLARAGREVVLIDREPPPRDKLCGEFLSPESEADLEDLGLSAELARVGSPRIGRARFTVPSGRVARFALPGPGRGLSRLALDAMLWRRAEAAGARTCVGEVLGVEQPPAIEGVELTLADGAELSRLRARWLVAAHGRHRRLDRALERTPNPNDLRRFAGLKRHHFASAALARELADHVEIHVFSGGYCGMSHVEGGRVNVCALVDTAWLRAQKDRSWPALFRAMAAEQPRLEARRRDLVPAPDRELQTVGAVDLERRRAVAGPAFVVGDASAVIAPLAGDGQAMALSGGRRLAELLLEAGPDAPFDVVAARWSARFQRTYAARLSVARGLQGALWRPWAAEGVVRAAEAWPGLAGRLARWTREPRPPSARDPAEPGRGPGLDADLGLRDR